MAGSDKKDTTSFPNWDRKSLSELAEHRRIAPSFNLEKAIAEIPFHWPEEARRALNGWLRHYSLNLSRLILKPLLAPEIRDWSIDSREPDERDHAHAGIKAVLEAFRSEIINKQGPSPATINRIMELSRAAETAERVARKEKKGEIRAEDVLRSRDDLEASEGPIDRHSPPQMEAAINSNGGLPTKPGRYWPGRRPGRPSLDDQGLLLSFLEDVYGRYLPQAKDELRDYIFRNDPKLYDALRDFERNNVLPQHLHMPTRDEKYLARLEIAEAVNFAGMSPREKAHAQSRLEALRKIKLGYQKNTPH